MTTHDSYEDLTQCGLTPELEAELVNTARECTFMWTNKKGEAFGVIMAYLPKDGKLWLTCARARARVPALKRFDRASICITSAGLPMGNGKTVTYKGSCVIHDEDRTVKDWFYPEFSRWVRPLEEQAVVFQQFLDSPDRVVIEFTPDYTLSFNSELMWARSPNAQ